MARIVYIANSIVSELNRGFGLSHRLTEAGHEVIYLSPYDVGERIEAQGFRFIRLESELQTRARMREEMNPFLPIRSIRSLQKSIRIARKNRQSLLRKQEISECVKQLNPDLLIVNIEIHYAVLTAISLRIPTLLVINWFSIFRRPGLPPMHTKLQPAETIVARFRIWYHWTILLLGRRLKFATRHLSMKYWKRKQLPISLGTNHRDDLVTVAKQLGVSCSRETDQNQWLAPHVYPHLPVISFNAKEMDFPHDNSGTNMQYVGPLFKLRSLTPPLDDEHQTRLNSFYETARSNDRALIYCSLGTFWTADQRLLTRVIEVVRRRSDWSLIVGLGGTFDHKDLPDCPDNALVLNYAPQLQVLKHCNVAITHGGISTINECVYRDVPMLVYSTGHIDQDGCAARIEFHKLGIVGNAQRDTSGDIESNLEKLLGNHEIAANVTAMKQVLSKYEKSDAALRSIENLLHQERVD